MNSKIQGIAFIALSPIWFSLAYEPGNGSYAVIGVLWIVLGLISIIR